MNASLALTAPRLPTLPGWRRPALLALLISLHAALLYGMSRLTVAHPATSPASVMMVSLVEDPPKPATLAPPLAAAPALAPATAPQVKHPPVPRPTAATPVARPEPVSPVVPPTRLTPEPAAPAPATPPAASPVPESAPAATTVAKPAAPLTTGPATTPATGSNRSSGDEAPGPRLVSGVAYLREPAPEFPAASRRLGEQGTVMVKVLVDEQGHAAEVQIHRSSGFNRLDRAASRAVAQAVFRPYSINGRAQSAWTIVPIHFKLEAAEEVSS